MFCVYFPGKTGYSDQHFRDAGLGDLLDETVPTFGDFLPGPDGAPGVFGTWSKEQVTGPQQFEWKGFGVQGSGFRYYLGKAAGEPKPEWFARANQQVGRDVTMADGQRWHIPTARQLPALLGLDDQDRLTSTVLPQYRAFFEAAYEAVKWFQPDDQGRVKVSYRAGFDFVCLALSINYRINPRIASWLGLVHTDSFFEVADVAAGVTDFFEAQKKTA